MATKAEIGARAFLRKLEQFTGPRMIRVVNEAIRELRDLVKTKHMGAAKTGPNRLARNTGKMEDRTIATRAVRTPNGNVSATLKINVPYASVHFGEGGKLRTLIVPKRKQALTIPLDHVKGANKRARFAANSNQITGKYVTDAGVLYGTLPGGRSQLPLFVLRPSVVVPVRIQVERDIQPEAERILERILRREAEKIFGREGV